MKKLIIDSSVMVKWVNKQGELLIDKADRILTDAQKKGIVLLAPDLAIYEVGNALLYKGMELPQAVASLGTIYSLPVKFVGLSEPQALETMEIAQQFGMTFYDAAFVSLAREKSAILVTDNPKHQKKFTGVKIMALRDYE